MSQANPTDIECTKYAENYVLYGDQSRAFRAAFPDSKATPESINVKAVEFHKIVKVQLRIAELHASINGTANEAALFTAEEAIRELNENREAAKEVGQVAAMNQSTMGKAKIAGLLIDKQELTGKDGKDLVPDAIQFVPYDGEED